MAREVEDHAIGTADIAAAADRRQAIQQRDAEQQQGVPPMPRNEMDGSAEKLAPLFDHQLAEDMRRRWSDIQSGFVDDPGRAVQQADELVAQALQDLARSFSHHRAEIESEAKGGDAQPSTENLRIALRRYRSFFERLLSL